MADPGQAVIPFTMETSGFNLTTNASLGNYSEPFGNETASRGTNPLSYVFATFYGIICVAGLVGNGLVIFVVMKYAKMKTVTNMYILNLAVADLCFLIGLLFLIPTMLLRNWIFGYPMCKFFYLLTSINWFTSVFTLIVMSADRYVAVCHAIPSLRYRTPLVSRVICVCVWLASLIVMLPIVLYARLDLDMDTGKESCTITWPADNALGIEPQQAFMSYAMVLGFALPVGLISVFYTLVILRLKNTGPKKKSKEKKKSHRRVTRMVLTIISAYVICWLPYWLFQMILSFSPHGTMPRWSIYAFQVITVLSYMNSMLNPLLYAFLSENFRKSFIKAFKCADNAEVNRALQAETSIYPGRKSNNTKKCKTILQHVDSEEELEFQTTHTFTTSRYDTHESKSNGSNGKVGINESGNVITANHMDDSAECPQTAV